jgi:hypothetical protein
VVTGLGSGAGDLSSNPGDGLSTYIKVYVYMCTVHVNNGIFMYLCMLVWIFLLRSCLFFFYIQCPATLLVQSANQRSVWRDGGIWLTGAASRVIAVEYPCCIWLSHAKCGGLEKYPSSLHWIGKSAYELWNCAWLLSPGRVYIDTFLSDIWLGLNTVHAFRGGSRANSGVKMK